MCDICLLVRLVAQQIHGIEDNLLARVIFLNKRITESFDTPFGLALRNGNQSVAIRQRDKLINDTRPDVVYFLLIPEADNTINHDHDYWKFLSGLRPKSFSRHQ